MEKSILRLIQVSKQSFFLFGPRGTGKTTWLKVNFPQAFFIDLLEADTFRTYNAHPERLREVAFADSRLKTIVIDEVQKVPELLGEVHASIEKKTGMQFILTGSSIRKLKRGGTDLMAGRLLKYSLHPFMAAELLTLA
ncbi:MAG: AAA family ATPase [Candidatus Omnitrophota bacterium]